MKAEIKTILISEGHNFYGRYDLGADDHAIVEKKTVDLVAGKGIQGDRFF